MQSMTPSARKRAEMKRQRIEREAESLRLKWAAAGHIMALWNAALAAGWRTIFYPTIATALATECHWLHVVCPACQQMGETDLRTIDIHPNASIGTVVRAMSCKRCSPNPPFARPLGATRRSWEGNSRWKRERKKINERVQTDDVGWGRRRVAMTKKKGEP